MAAAAATATAYSTAILGGARLPRPCSASPRSLLLAPLSRRSLSASPSSFSFLPLVSAPRFAFQELQRFSLLQVRATSSSEETPSSIQGEELFADLKEKWDSIENKSTVFLYGGGAIVAVWLSSVVVGAINSVPLLPKIMELVGLGYTGWFVYRYLLFKQSRKELVEDIETLKKKITGTGE